jgi:hypothetical protein
MQSNDTRDISLNRRYPASESLSVLSSQSSDSEETKEGENKETNALLEELESQGVKPEDVFCGRDKYSYIHPGNRHYRMLIETHRTQYQKAATRRRKAEITMLIASTIKEHGGRFLKMEGPNWVEIDFMCTKEKISHALRSAKDPLREKTKKPRKNVKRTPTNEEDKLFEETLKHQRKIFQELTEKEAAGHIDPNHLDVANLISYF